MRKVGEPDYWKQFSFKSAWKGMHLFTFHDYYTKIFDGSQIGADWDEHAFAAKGSYSHQDAAC